MKKQILFIVMMLMPIVASAQKTVKIDNIHYKLFSETNEAEVINRFPFFYSGDIVIPQAVVYEDAEYHQDE